MRILACLLVLLLAGCESEQPADDDTASDDDTDVAPGCGDGVLDADEECDDGAANSDVEPDACRTDCFAAHCGDGVTDIGEECDDGTAWGGDGCTPICTPEDGQLENEPNDTPLEAEAWEGGAIHGALDEGDVDCFSLQMPACAALEARLVGVCDAPAVLGLSDPDGAELAVGTPGVDGCAELDPAHAPGARFVAEGQWTVCVQGLMDGAVPFYELELVLVDPEDATYVIDEADDPDGDGKPDQCDADRDGDGVDNEDDNCPDTPNGPDTEALTPSTDGFLRVWLAAGSYTGLSSPDTCLPTEENLVAEDDATVTPSIGDAAGDALWTVLWSPSDRVEFLWDYGHVDAPREVYQALYLYSATARDVTFGHGPDDGAKTWLNGDLVQEISGCQGTVIDYVTTEVSLVDGWNTLVIKVYDQGGGWGNYVRFLDGETPVTDLEISLDPAGAWVPDQTDTDGDGEGDVCDDTPQGA